VRKGYPDFTIFYSAGKIVREGLGRQMYDEATQYRVQQEFAGGVSIRQSALPYNHPPFEALLFVPFTYLPYFPAYLCWGAINLLLIAGLSSWVRPHLPLLRAAPAALWAVAGLSFFPIFVSFLQGQDMVLLLALLSFTFLAIEKNADVAAGGCLALGMFRPHLVLPMLLFLLWRRGAKVLLGFVPVSTLLLLVSIAVAGWKGLLSYPGYVWHIEQTMGRGAIVPADMPNIRGLADTLLGRFSPIFSLLLTLAVSLILVVFAAGKRGKSDKIRHLQFSLWIITTVLVSYHAFAYDLSLLVLPMLLVWDHARSATGNRTTNRLLILPILFLLTSPLQMVLRLRYGLMSLVALVLLLWWWAIAREVRAVESSTA